MLSPIVVALRSIVTGDYKTAQAPAVTAVKEPAKGIEVDEFQFSILQQSIDSGFLVFYIEVSVNENCVLKAARAYMVFDALEGMGEIVKSTPSVQEIEQEKFDRSFSLYFISQG